MSKERRDSRRGRYVRGTPGRPNPDHLPQGKQSCSPSLSCRNCIGIRHVDCGEETGRAFDDKVDLFHLLPVEGSGSGPEQFEIPRVPGKPSFVFREAEGYRVPEPIVNGADLLAWSFLCLQGIGGVRYFKEDVCHLAKMEVVPDDIEVYSRQVPEPATGTGGRDIGKGMGIVTNEPLTSRSLRAAATDRSMLVEKTLPPALTRASTRRVEPGGTLCRPQGSR